VLCTSIVVVSETIGFCNDSLEHLQQLESAGMHILVCGTCLDFFGLKAELAAGIISNMQDIAQVLSRGTVLRM